MKIKVGSRFAAQILKALWFGNHSGTQGHPSAKLTGPPAFASGGSGVGSGAQGLGSQRSVSDFNNLTLLTEWLLLSIKGPLERAELYSKRSDLPRERWHEGP